ncbi:MAG: hypothetical protein K2H58_05245, partial [Paramuribaculum sp.]|nr:hypothetical protein [Paramuribaculum sp.]
QSVARITEIKLTATMIVTQESMPIVSAVKDSDSISAGELKVSCCKVTTRSPPPMREFGVLVQSFIAKIPSGG